MSFLSFGGIKALDSIKIELFYADVRQDFESIEADKSAVKNAVRWLFDNNRLNHDFTKAVYPDAPFSEYWKRFENNWMGIQMDAKGDFELVFNGQPIVEDEQECGQIFMKFGDIWKEMYWEKGLFLGFQIHPNTGEVLMIHHRYPCCSQYTNTLTRLRLVGLELKSIQKYFLARKGGMKGTFFPKNSSFKLNYEETSDTTTLYWSEERITKNAMSYYPTNAVVRFAPKSRYKVLWKGEKSDYVMFVDPLIDEPSELINPINLQKMKMLGWIMH